MSGCNFSQPELVSFSSNNEDLVLVDNIDELIKDNELSIVYFSRAQLDYGWYKIFTLENNSWFKIEVRPNSSTLEGEKVTSIPDSINKILCQEEEAQEFLNQLIKLNAFNLPSENSLISQCEVPEPIHSKTRYLIIKGYKKLRGSKYKNVGEFIKKCPDVNAWQNIMDIEKLFTEKW